MERRTTLSTNEWAVLGLIADEARHGYDIATELRPQASIGEAWHLRRDGVYRALERLEGLGHIAPRRTEAGDAAPPRTIYAVTRTGRRALDRWLATPIEHLRDVRSILLLKIVLHQRLGRDVTPLLRAQSAAFAVALDDRARPADGDIIGLWRHHAANAVAAFLDEAHGVARSR